MVLRAHATSLMLLALARVLVLLSRRWRESEHVDLLPRPQR